jgi:hypothetical protein
MLSIGNLTNISNLDVNTATEVNGASLIICNSVTSPTTTLENINTTSTVYPDLYLTAAGTWNITYSTWIIGNNSQYLGFSIANGGVMNVSGSGFNTNGKTGTTWYADGGGVINLVAPYDCPTTGSSSH